MLNMLYVFNTYDIYNVFSTGEANVLFVFLVVSEVHRVY